MAWAVTNGSVGTSTITVPAGEVGDLLVAVACSVSGSGFNALSGWTKQHDNGYLAIWDRLADGSETTFTNPALGSYKAGFVIRASGNSDSPFSSDNSTAAIGGATPAATGLTLPESGQLVIAAAHYNANYILTPSPSGYSNGPSGTNSGYGSIKAVYWTSFGTGATGDVFTFDPAGGGGDTSVWVGAYKPRPRRRNAAFTGGGF